jgi:hypothetical protein
MRGFARIDEDVEFSDFPWSAAVGIIVAAEGASAFRDLIETGSTRS